MFYISGFDDSSRLWKVIDTDDNVEDAFSFKSLKDFIHQGIKIYGVDETYCNKCVIVDSIIFIPDIKNNTLVIKSIINDKTLDTLNFSSIPNKRNTVWFNGNIEVKKKNHDIVVQCGVCVKYDFEFTGLYVIKVNSNGNITARLDDVLFVCDDAHEAHRMISNTGNDCPNFITSVKAHNILKAKGII